MRDQSPSVVSDAGTEARYRAVPAEIYDVNGQLSLAASESCAASVPLGARSAAVLRHCLAERSLREHADHAARALGIGSGRELDSELAMLARAGLLRRIDWTKRTSAPTGPTPAAEIRTVAILTADRPNYLARCLQSYLDHLTASGTEARLLVVDHSRTPAHSRDTERHVVAAAASAHQSIQYAGEQSRQSLRERALAAGFAAGVIDWLMPSEPPNRSAGSGRNHVLLLTAGEPVLMADDDTVCTVWRHEEADDDIAFVGHNDPNDMRVFHDRTSAIAAIQRTTDGLLAAHQALLGCRLADLAVRGSRDTTHVCRHLTPVFEGLRPAWTVRATWAGLAGDAGTYCPYPLLFHAGPARDRLAAADNLATALASREVVRSVRRPTVTDEPWFMTYCAAVDGSTLLPPFSPVGTNEDGLFGAMLRMCDPTAFIGQIPYGVVHDSGRLSPYDLGVIPSASSVRLADLVRWVSAAWTAACVETDVSTRMRGLGRHLMACGRLEPSAWRAHLTRLIVDARRRVLIATQSVLDDGFPYPAPWRQAIGQYQQAVLDCVTSADACVPVEYRSCPSAEAAADAVQEYFRRLGEALVVWPDLWQLCRDPA